MAERKTVVVVDDEPITRIDLCQMLEELGYSVAGSAADGFDAVELCRAANPSAVLMDIKMPVFDGLTAAETLLRERLAGCVVLLTAFCEPELIDRATKAGVTGYLVKPVDERLLMPSIEVAVAQARRLREAREENARLRERLEDMKLIERAKALLAKEKGIAEAEAYRQLQRLAMDKRRPLASLARAVVERGAGRETVDRAKELLMHAHGINEAAAHRRIAELGRRMGGELAAAREILGRGGQGPL